MLLALAGLSACAGSGYGVGAGYGYGYDYDYDYYEPQGFYYGGWGPGYLVGPPRGGVHRPRAGGGGAHGGSRPYNPAPAGRPMPGIPGGGGGRGHR